MSHLSLRLLGGFEVRRDGRPVTEFGYDKVRALLAYIAIESEVAHTRHTLAALLWPEQDEARARQSLRQALSALRGAIADVDGEEAFVFVGRESIQFNTGSSHDIDARSLESWPRGSLRGRGVLEARAICRQQHLQKAARYRGTFLAGFSLPEAAEFENWLQVKRQWFDARASELFQHLTSCYELGGEYEGAMEYARRLLRLEPWNEGAHRQVMRLLAIRGQRGAALAHYRRCERALAAELGVEPESETVALYEQISRGGVGPASSRLPVELLAEAEPSEAPPCGAAPPGHAGELRVLTVLSCELAGALSEDPETLYERLSAYHRTALATIAGCGGQVVERDGAVLTAYFGYPRPCEGASLQAVRAASALRKWLDVRVRVHTGTVLIPPNAQAGCGLHREVVGAVPEIARRLHHAADRESVVITEATRKCAGESIEYRALGRFKLPNHPSTLRLYGVGAERDALQRLQRGYRTLAGRDRELTALRGYLSKALQGHGHTVVLAGERGAGKTTLAAALWTQAEGERVLRLAACCAPQEAEAPFGPARSLIAQLIGGRGALTPAARLQRLEALLRRYTMVDALAPLSWLLEPRATDSRSGLVPIGGGPAEAGRRACELLIKAAQERSTLIVVEDVQWADRSTLALLGRLSARLLRVPALVVLTADRRWAPPWRTRADWSRLELGPLPAGDMAAMLRRHIPGIDEALIERTLARSGGVPSFALALAENASGRGTGARSSLAGADLPLPVMECLGARLDRLGTAKGLVQLAASLGPQFDERTLDEALAQVRSLGFDPGGLLTVLKGLTNEGILAIERAPAGIRYRFEHALLREAAYTSQSRRQRELYGRLAAGGGSLTSAPISGS